MIADDRARGGAGANEVVVVAQGGLAPLGVLVGAGEAEGAAVSHVVLTSPPSWELVSSEREAEELAREWSLFNGLFGSFFWFLAKTELFIRFFSDAALFAGKADDTWVGMLKAVAQDEAQQRAR